MKYAVMIKSSKYGLRIFLDAKAPYEEVKEQLRERFVALRKFLKHATMAVTFEGRVLTCTQEQELVELMCEAGEITITCIVDQSENTAIHYRKILDKCKEKTPKQDGQFYKGTLKRHQILESDTSIVILGDVEAGATVAAKGNIVVLGNIRGNVHAGVSGRKSAVIVGLSFYPNRVRIADMEAKQLPYSEEEDTSINPKIAGIRNAHLYIRALAR